MREKRRYKGRGLAALAAGGVALAVMWTPVGLLEMLVASTGLSEALPAAAPPLGLTARLLIAGFAALMAVGLVSAMNKDGSVVSGADHGLGGRKSAAAKGESKMGFALSKIAAMARGRMSGAVSDARPTLRRADAHPDAPARAPIFASRDFDGLDIFNRAANRAKNENKVAPVAAAIVMPTVDQQAAPRPWERQEDAGPRFATPAFVSPDLTPPATPPLIDAVPVAVEPVAPEPIVPEQVAPEPAIEQPLIAPPLIEPPVPTEGLTITQLTARLERGLAQRAAARPPRVIADMPVAAAVPVRDTVDTDVDQALAAALGTLRTMAARGR